jgi:transposase
LRDVPERYGPHTTCSNRFRRWRKAACETNLWKRCHAVEQVGGAPAIIRLSFGQLERDQETAGVYDRLYLGGQAPRERPAVRSKLRSREQR